VNGFLLEEKGSADLLQEILAATVISIGYAVEETVIASYQAIAIGSGSVVAGFRVYWEGPSATAPASDGHHQNQ